MKIIQLHALNKSVEIPQSDNDEDSMNRLMNRLMKTCSDEESDYEIVISEIFEESGERSDTLEKNCPFAIFNSDSENET